MIMDKIPPVWRIKSGDPIFISRAPNVRVTRSLTLFPSSPLLPHRWLSFCCNDQTSKPHLLQHLKKNLRRDSSKMAKKKIKINKIGNLTARQVTFLKRRRGLIKKAEDLSVLGDADVSLIIFSAAGKLYDFSSSSVEEILARYILHSDNVEKPVQPCPELQIKNYNHELLSKEVNDEFHKLRQMKEEYLEGLNMEELAQLENKVEAVLSLVIKTESFLSFQDERALKEINKLQRKEARLIKWNKQMKQEMNIMTLHGGKSVTVSSEGEGVLLESLNNVSIGSNSVPPVGDDSSHPST